MKLPVHWQILLGFCLLVGLFAPTTASGAIIVYDLRVDYSNANNPNGTWQYLKGASLLTQYSPVSQPGLAAAVAGGYWGDSASSNNSAIMKTTANGSAAPPFSNSDFLIDEVLVRTTDPATGGPMIVTWTAPSDGSLTYSGGLWNANSPLGPGGATFLISLNAAPVESGIVFSANDRNSGVGMLNGLNPIGVQAGDVFALQIDPLAGPPTGALTGVTWTIDFTPVPEPSGLTLAAAGLAGLAWQLGRRRYCGKCST